MQWLYWIVCVLLTPTFASLAFSNNLSAPVSSNGWQFRSITLEDKYNFISQDASNDSFVGAFYNDFFDLPFAFVSHFAANSDVPSLFDSRKFQNASMASAQGYMGVVALSIDEVDPSGNVVLSRSLQWAPVATWTSAETGDSTSDLRKFTFSVQGNAIPGWRLSITYVLSQVSGVLDYSIPVVPPSLTAVYNIPSWSYNSTNNSLRLVLLVGTGPSSSSEKGVLASNDNQVYFALNKTATWSGGNTAVNISSFTGFSGSVDTPSFSYQLASKYGAAASFNLVNITFPPGASGIVYSYSTGIGQRVKGGDWNASKPLPSTSMAATLSYLSLLYLLVVVVI